MELPSYSGQQYEVTVPDTLDLQEMAALTINGMTGPTNPEADYTVYWPCMLHFCHHVSILSVEPFSEIPADGDLENAEDRQLTGKGPHSTSFHRRNRRKATHLSGEDRLPP